MEASYFVIPQESPARRWEHGIVYDHVREFAIDLGEMHWYGLGGLIHQLWPLEKVALPVAPFRTADAGWNGLLGILEPFWAASSGLGIMVEGEDMEMGFNAPLSKDLPRLTPDGKKLPNHDRPRASRGLDTDGRLTIKGEDLSIRIFEKGSLQETIRAYWTRIPDCPPPPASIFERPMWTTWAHLKNDISQEKILETAREAIRRGFNPGVFGIDAKWQAVFGDTSFDAAKFPDPKLMIEELHSMGCEVTLWIVPFFMQNSGNFEEAVNGGYVLKNEDGSPYLGKWWEGESVFLDLINPEALGWFLAKLEGMKEEYGIDGFKFDAGEAQFYEAECLARRGRCAPNSFAGPYLRKLAAHYPWSDARAGWRNQGIPMLFRQWDKKTVWGYDNGLASCITQALTLNLLGYRYSFPDMIGGNEWGGDCADEEMMIRWAEAVSPMPVMQFSVPPWLKGERCSSVCARYARLHAELAPLHVRLSLEALPILRPIWWLAPHDENALLCDDEYMVGDDLLVAPVITPGARERDVYLPGGRWRERGSSGEIHEGGKWLRNFPAKLEDLPLFERVS